MSEVPQIGIHQLWSGTTLADGYETQMRVLRHFSNIPADLKGCTVVIGNFDGVHRGHQTVIGRAAEIARKSDTPLIAMTFEPHPRHYFKPDTNTVPAYAIPRQGGQIDALGVDAMLVVAFNRLFSQITADEFVDDVLVAGLRREKRRGWIRFYLWSRPWRRYGIPRGKSAGKKFRIHDGPAGCNRGRRYLFVDSYPQLPDGR